MSRSKSVLIFGPPSSGTRLMTRIVMEAGFLGSPDHIQVWDTVKPNLDRDTSIVIRRHHPGDRLPEWCKNRDLIGTMLYMGYEVDVIVMSRDWNSTIKSMMKAPHARSEEGALDLIRKCWNSTLYHMSGYATDIMRWEIINYEALCSPHGYGWEILGRMMDRFRWRMTVRTVMLNCLNKGITLEDRNVKYYGLGNDRS